MLAAGDKARCAEKAPAAVSELFAPSTVRQPVGLGASLAGFAIPAIRFAAINRRRLFGDGLLPLTIVTAPAGYGKTTAVIQWVLDLNVSVRWVVPEVGLARPEDLWRLLAHALGGEDDTPRRDSSWRSRLEQVVATLTEETVLVVDDYHRVTEPDIDLDLAGLLSISSHLHSVVVGWRLTSLDGPLVTSRFATTHITVRELALTWEETEKLALIHRRQGCRGLPELFDAVQGWPMPICSVLSRSLEDAPDEPNGCAPLLSVFVDDFLRLALCPSDRRLLFASAVCPGVQVRALVESLDGIVERGDGPAQQDDGRTPGLTQMNPEHQGLASATKMRDLGLVLQVPPYDAFRISCHPGLAIEIRRRAEDALSSQELRRLKLRYAHELEDLDPVSAFALLLELGDYDSAGSLAQRRFHDLVAQGPRTTEVLAGIPLESIVGSMGLTGLRVMLRAYDTSLSVMSLKELLAQFRSNARREAQRKDTGFQLQALNALIEAEMLSGDVEVAWRLALDLERRLSDTTNKRRSLSSEALTLLHTTIALAGLLNEDWRLEERHSRRALRVATQTDSLVGRIRGLRSHALAAYAYGAARTAEKLVVSAQHLESEWASQNSLGPVLPDWYVTEALLLADRSEGRALSALLFPYSAARPFLISGPLLLIAEIEMVRRNRGTYLAVRELNRRLTTHAAEIGGTNLFTRHLQLFSADLSTMLGDLGSAERQLNDAPVNRPGTAISRARLHLFRGDPAAAVQAIQTLPSVRLTIGERLDANLITAIGSWELGMSGEAHQAALEAMHEMETFCGYRALSWLPFQPLQELAVEAESQGVPELRAHVEALPDTLRCEQYQQLSVAELRVLAALAEGNPLERTAEELFISMNTLKFHLRSIYRKLRVAGRAEAVRRATHIGILEPNRPWGRQLRGNGESSDGNGAVRR